MSADAPAAEPEKKPKKPGRVTRLTSAPSNMSAAGCASVLTAAFLICLVIVVWVVYWLDPNNVPWRHSMSWTRIVLEILLVAVIPYVLYKAIKLWLEGDASRFPDIDYAWKAGLDALHRNGLSLGSAPLFLVVGSAGVRQEKTLVRAAAISLRVQDVPEGPAPLHWYASPDGIYLFCTEASWASALAALVEKRKQEAAATGVTTPDSALAPMPVVRARRAEAAPRPAPAAPSSGSGRGTIMLDQFVADMQSQAEGKAAEGAETEESEPSAPISTPASDQPALLARQDSAEQAQRLAYVCQLLRRGRYPLCPLNGVLALLPFEVFQASPREAQELQRAIRSDLSNVQQELQARFPVTALIVGMQNERGFREIIRRVGRERSVTQRFGRRFDVRLVATAEQLSNLCVHVCGVFEDWIHTLFREADALSRPGNTRLYSLLCKIRCNFSPVLRDVLSGGFGYDPQQKHFDEPLAFSGCYFAATGDTEDQQAFVRGVFEKLSEEQEEVEWTRTARKADNRYQSFAVISAALSVALLLTICVVAVIRFAT